MPENLTTPEPRICAARGCEKSFPPSKHNPHKRFCSRVCANRDRYQIKDFATRICAFSKCTNTFKTARSNHHFCSTLCGQENHKERLRLASKERANIRGTRTCEARDCDNTFATIRDNHRFCSDPCKSRVARGTDDPQRHEPRTCAARDCQKTFVDRGLSSPQRYCSRQCLYRVRNGNDDPNFRPPRPCANPNCNEVFSPTRKGKIRLHCSPQCYADCNPEIRRRKNHKTRAQRLAAPGSFTAEQQIARFDFYGNRCAYCGNEDDLQIEHVIPIGKGGSNHAANIVPACAKCNSDKNAKPLNKWLGSREWNQIANGSYPFVYTEEAV